jgi:Carboxypeptidase regulatory-like domain/TonB dependent receptor-like, beta-barrel
MTATFRGSSVRVLKCVQSLSLTRITFALVLACLWCAPLFPQGNAGRILGTVTDQSGGAVGGASVTITDVARGTSRTIVTDADGAFVAINLQPGTYTVRVEAKGFKRFDRQNLLLEVGKDLNVDAVLQPGSANEVITVTEEAPMIDSTSTTLGGTLNNEAINDLPLNGRNYQNLLTLRPGTMIYPGGGPWTQSTNGVRPEDTSYIVDGLTNDEAFMGLSVTNAAAVLGDAATLLPIDALQEFNTQVNPKAEFGWKPGAITSVGIKSGTNDIHGSAYAFGRSDSFDARNYFNPVGTPKTPASLEQFGGSVGGKIIPDKLFYFGAYEGQRYSVGNALPVAVPTTASVGDPSISIPDAIAAIGGAGNVNPLSNYLLQFYTPNASQGVNVVNTFPNVNSSNNAVGKVDYHLSDKNNFSGSYFFGNDNLIGMDSNELLPEFRTNVHSRAQALAVHWAYIPSSAWANELRYGFTHYTLNIVPANVDIKYDINTGITNPVLGGLPNIRMSPFTEMGGFHNFPKIVGPDSVNDIIDQVSYLKGKHAFKFGGEYRLDQVHQATYRAGRGRIRFSTLEDFLLGNVEDVSLLAGNPTRNLTQNLFAGYAQDDWRITRKIILNLGLRYEYQGVPTEANNLLGNWEPNVGLEQVGRNIGSIYKGDHRNFSPRIGIAWDISGKGTTVIRAGGSIIYDLLSMNTFLSQQNTNNTVTLGLGVVPTGAPIITCPAATCGVTGVPVVTQPIGNILAAGVDLPGSAVNWVNQTTQIYPSNLTSTVQCGDGVTPPATAANPNPVPDPQPCSFFAMNRNYRTPYVENWTLGVQQAFSNKFSLDVAYVGNHGTKLPGLYDVNQPNVLAGTPPPYAVQYPYLQYINYFTNAYASTYSGLQTTFTGRNYHGLDVLLGYTYSHAIDNLSFNWNQLLPENAYNLAAEKGSSDFDIRQRFTLSLTYTIPGKKMKGQLLEGWQVNSIITVQTAQPWAATDANFNFSGNGESSDRWNFLSTTNVSKYGNPGDFVSGGPNPIPCFGPACNNVDPSTPNGIPAVCNAGAAALGPATVASLNAAQYCYIKGHSMLIPNGMGQYGNMGRNVFRDTGFRNVDFSVTKNFKFTERFAAQFRAEFFNLFNHPNFANPYGGTNGYGLGAFADPSQPGSFGCGCATPDAASFNPLLGSGSNRAMQLGLKLLF